MNLHDFFFGVYPYLAGTVFILGNWLRFDREQYTWKSDSSQLLSKKYMRVASNMFHIGIICIFFGHLGGLLTPHSWVLAAGITDLAHQYMAMILGIIFGLTCLTGGIMLWLRRLYNRRIRATSRLRDIFILGWIMATLLLGLSTIPVSWGHAGHNDPATMIALTTWAQSIVTFSPVPAAIAGVHLAFKVHVVMGMTIFLLFPFTRLVHVWSVPVQYLGRAYQIVRLKRVLAR